MAAWVAALLALVLASAAPAAQAQTTAESPPTWAEGPALTGDWGGVRTGLADRGFAPYATYTIEGFGAAGTGIDDGADWTSVLEFGFDVDAQKLIGLPGGSLHASALWIEGTDPRERVGNLNAISSLSAPAAARLYQLWYKQILGPVTAKIGQVLASDDFMVSAAVALYFNAGFGTYPTFTANINAPTYPLGAPGAVVVWQAAEVLQRQAGVYVADAGPNDAGNTGFGWSTDHGWAVSSEIAYKPKPGGLAGVYKLGGYYDTACFPDLVSGERDRGNWSLHVLGDQTIYAGAEGTPTVTVFAGAGLSPQQDRNAVHYYVQGGGQRHRPPTLAPEGHAGARRYLHGLQRRLRPGEPDGGHAGDVPGSDHRADIPGRDHAVPHAAARSPVRRGREPESTQRDRGWHPDDRHVLIGSAPARPRSVERQSADLHGTILRSCYRSRMLSDPSLLQRRVAHVLGRPDSEDREMPPSGFRGLGVRAVYAHGTDLEGTVCEGPPAARSRIEAEV